jgi:putative ABC transport system permease protein
MRFWKRGRRKSARSWKSDAAIREEIDFYLEMRTRELIERGLDREEARRRAIDVFGDPDWVAGECRAVRIRAARHPRGTGFLFNVGYDIRHTVRSLLKAPVFAAITILTLAIGIGANTAIFSVVSGVLLQPLPYDEPDDLVAIYTYFSPESGMDFPKYAVGSPEYFDYIDQNNSMQSVAAVSTEWVNISEGDGEPEVVVGGLVSPSMFTVLRTPPLLGRTLVEADGGPNPKPVYVLGYDLWRGRFGGDSTIVGRTIDVGIEVAEETTRGEVVGVMPPGFNFPEERTELWTPLPLDPARTWRGGHWFWMIARLAPATTFDQADAEMEAMMERWAVDYPDHHVGHGLWMLPLLDETVGHVRAALLLLMGAVGFVLLIACANVANLLLAHGETRWREISVRSALGAGRKRILQQLLTESFVLAAVGGAIGVALSGLGVDALMTLQTGAIPRVGEIGLDGRVLAFSVGVILLTAVVFGLVPALREVATDLTSAFKEGNRGQTVGRGRVRLRSTLIVSEIAVAILLVVGAGLMTKSFWNLTREDLGFETERLLFTSLSLPGTNYTGEEAVAFFEQLQERVRAIPGVSNAAVVSRAPLRVDRSQSRFHIEGRADHTPGELGLQASYVTAGHGLFETMGIPLVRGRLLNESDRAGTPHVVVIDERMANLYWPGEDPLGKQIWFGLEDGPRHTIVGIVGNAKFDRIETAYPTYYHPYEQLVDWASFMARTNSIVARTSIDPAGVASAIGEAVHDLDPNLPILTHRSMSEIVGLALARPRFILMLLVIFAGVALLLGSIGIYGIIAHTVSQRTSEIGVRMALGARSRDVVAMVVRQGLLLALTGTIIGLVAALAATRVMAGLLFDVSATDPLTFVAVASLVVAVALGASYIPARRAARVDPVDALRRE